jgi:hypothetical protein
VSVLAANGEGGEKHSQCVSCHVPWLQLLRGRVLSGWQMRKLAEGGKDGQQWMKWQDV